MTIRNFTLGMASAAALVAGLLLIRQQKQTQPKKAGKEAENPKSAITLERMRELGL